MARLLEWVENLPGLLRLNNPDGSSRPYHFEVAQLHIYYLTALCILFRPRSFPGINPENTAAVLASSLCHSLLEGIQLRDQMCSLGPIFGWCVFVAAIPQFSCAVLPSLWEGKSQGILHDLEGFLTGWQPKWPSATFNLNEMHRLREITDSVALNRLSLNRNQTDFDISSPSMLAPQKLFQGYGKSALQSYGRIHASLSSAMPAQQQVSSSAALHLQRQQQGPIKTLVGHNFQELTSSITLSTSGETALVSEGLSATSEMTPILPDEAFQFDTDWYEMDWADLLMETGAHNLN